MSDIVPWVFVAYGIGFGLSAAMGQPPIYWAICGIGSAVVYTFIHFAGWTQP